MSSTNNSVKCVEISLNKNNNNINDEKSNELNELNVEKSTNDCSFWELITDVAKDLDLALQDLSPDFEISDNISNGVIDENAGNDPIGSEEPSNSILFEPIVVGITGNNTKQNRNELQSKSNTQSVDCNDISADLSSAKTSSLLQTNSCALLPTFTAHSSPLSSSIPLINASNTSCVVSPQSQKTCYSLQLLSVMDNIQISSDNNNSNTEALSTCSQTEKNENHILPEISTLLNNKDFAEDDKNEDNSGASCESIPITIGLLERLIRCHPIWFLPEIGRAGVVHLLQGKEPGCFIVRQSSKANTMALSVRLPEGRGPHIEHYLIEDGGNGKLHLEGSDNYFSAIPMLVCHYSNCCDELPVQLTLCKVLSQSNRQQLTSLALLGQDFWQSSLSKLSNSNEDKSDNSFNDSNSLNRRTNSCSTFKSDTKPPPVPPKQDVSTIDPIIDTKKSSTVPISQVMAQTPKLPPRRPDPPPIPPRSKFVSIKNKQNSKTDSTPKSTALNNNTNNSAKEDSNEPKAPNTEVTEIQITRDNSSRDSIISLVSNSSQTSLDNKPKDGSKSSTNAQKVLCYRSSLLDKESDYEDIWGANSASKLTLNSTLEGIAENEVPLVKCHSSTQTETTTLMKSSSNRQVYSPFYIDPIDAIPNRRLGVTKSWPLRRSDTEINELKPSTNASFFGHSMESMIDSIRSQSTHIDTCHQIFSAVDPNLQDVSVQVGYSTFVRHSARHSRESSWPLDNSWQWLDDNLSSLCGQSFRRESMTGCRRRRSFVDSMKSDVTTVEDMISLQAPELSVSKAPNLMNDSKDRSVEQKSEPNERYDNLAVFRNYSEINAKQEVINDTDTEFSEPWDSDWWEGLLKKVFPRNALIQFSPETEDNHFVLNRELMAKNCENSSTITSLSDSHMTSTFDITEVSSIADMRSNCSETENRESTTSDRLTVLETNDCGIGLNICHYVFKLSAEGNNTFAKAVDHFIQCTQESNETNPLIVMRNIRQFMNGIKNYLVKHGEGQLSELIQEERSKLKSNEFLNIDAILESALHRLVIKPLKNFLYLLFINEYNRNGSLKLLSKNIKESQSKSPQELGVRPELLPIDYKTIVDIQKHLKKLNQSYSPLKKLEYLLCTISTIYNSVRQHQKKRSSSDSNTQHKSEYLSFGADDFLPLFIYVLIQCGVISAEIEADYMFGLLHPSILSGEGGYYLTTLSSAVHVLKNIHELNSDCNTINSNAESSDSTIVPNATPVQHMNSSSSETSVASGGQHSPYTQIKLPTIADLKAYMKIMIPDEFTSNIVMKTLPVRPNMTTKEVCRMIAHKFKITNPEDFGLFKVINGEEILLNETDFPQVIKSEEMASGRECLFAYKRCDAKFIWPITAP